MTKPDGDDPQGKPRVKRKARITMCGNVIPTVHECSTIALDITAMRLCIAIASQKAWSISVIDVSTASLDALTSSRHVYTKPPSIYVAYGPASPMSIMTIKHWEYGTLRLQRSLSHDSVWLVLSGVQAQSYASNLQLDSWFPDMSK